MKTWNVKEHFEPGSHYAYSTKRLTYKRLTSENVLYVENMFVGSKVWRFFKIVPKVYEIFLEFYRFLKPNSFSFTKNLSADKILKLTWQSDPNCPFAYKYIKKYKKRIWNNKQDWCITYATNINIKHGLTRKI